MTRLIRAAAQGDRAAEVELFGTVYEDLRRLAVRRSPRGPQQGAQQATALVHEAFLRLVRGKRPQFNCRERFFAAAALAMEQHLIDEYRRKIVRKAGVLSDDQCGLDPWQSWIDGLAVREHLVHLRASHPRAARVLCLHCFDSLTLHEVAATLKIGHATVERDLLFARTWLHSRLFPDR